MPPAAIRERVRRVVAVGGDTTVGAHRRALPLQLRRRMMPGEFSTTSRALRADAPESPPR